MLLLPYMAARPSSGRGEPEVAISGRFRRSSALDAWIVVLQHLAPDDARHCAAYWRRLTCSLRGLVLLQRTDGPQVRRGLPLFQTLVLGSKSFTKLIRYCFRVYYNKCFWVNYLGIQKSA